MRARVTKFGNHLLAWGACAALVAPLHAADADGQRGISIFDQHPECMERELKPADREKCTMRGERVAPQLAPRQQAGAGNAAQIGDNAGNSPNATPPSGTMTTPGSGDKAGTAGGASGSTGSAPVTRGAASR